MAMPWEMDKSLVDVIQSYDSQIMGESDDGCYEVQFYDNDANSIEAKILKKEFDSLPYKPEPGSHFFIVLYKVKGVGNLNLDVWPIAKHWHESWRK